MRRRAFVTLLGGTAVAWPLAARAQQSTKPVIGLINTVSFEGPFSAYVDEIRLGLKQTGLVEGRDVTIEYRTAAGHPERLPDLIGDLVRRQVVLIVAIGGTSSALAAKAATSVIPIVFANGGDAVESGLVKSLSRPEANVTGISFTTSQLAPKRLDLLRELVPQATLIAYLDNTVNPSEMVRRDLVARAGSIGREIVVFFAGTEPEIDRAFDAMGERHVGALIVGTDAYLSSKRERITSLAQRHAIPTITTWREVAMMRGGLISYSPLPAEVFRQAGVYAARILKGAKPVELPVLLPSRFELVINLKTAKALGLTVPPNLLAIADEVIE